MRTLIILIVLAALSGGAVYYWQRAPGQIDAKTPETSLHPVARSSILQSIASTGRVVSNLDVDIKCKASGAVVKLPFDVSDSVRQGDLLVELDPVDEQRAVDLAMVALSQSQAKLEQARRNLTIAEQNLGITRARIEANIKSAEIRAKDVRTRAERRKDLLQNNLGSQEDYDAAMALAAQAEADFETLKLQRDELKTQEIGLEVKRQDVTLAEADVASDRIALANAKRRLDETRVVAPIDGVVSHRNVQIGQIISSGITNVGGGTTILTLSDLSRVFALAAVDESDIGRVAPGQDVNVTVDAHPGIRFQGKVVRIATKGVNVSNVVTFEVKIEIVGPNKQLLKPEMTANIQIVAVEKHDVLTVLARAITLKGGKPVATVRTDAGAEERPVMLGVSDGTNWEVIGGLTEGDLVLVRKGEVESRWRADQPRAGLGSPVMMSPHGGGSRGRGR